MAYTDILIDTNVLVHASNSQENRQQDSINLINYLLGSTELICVDEGFSWDDENRSLIGAEYREYIKNGMLGYVFLVKIFSSKRHKECSCRVPSHVSKKINQCISNKKARDKTFLKVAINSASKVLVSHDYEDFDSEKREYIADEFGITIIEASEIV